MNCVRRRFFHSVYSRCAAFKQWHRDNPLPQLSSAESIFRTWDYSYYYFYYYCASNALCEFKFQFSEQKPLAHKNINFCPTSKEGKTVAEKSPSEDLSGAMCVCVCVCMSSRQRRKTIKARQPCFGLTLMLLFYVFPIFHVCLGALFLTVAPFFPYCFPIKQFISIEM